jgi:hypothetical protein
MSLKADVNIYAILGAFIITHIFLYSQFGIVSNLESEKYIKQAELLLKGDFPSAPKYYYYLPIILLIAFVKKLALGYEYIAIIQSTISAVAIIFFYKGTKLIYNKSVALISCLGLCLFIPFHSWDFFLYSESIFISISLFLYYAICRFENPKVSQLISIFAIIIILIFSRPFGLLFIPPLFVYFLFSKYTNKKIKVITIAASIIFLLMMGWIIDKILHGGEDMDAMKPFIEEHIICFLPQKPDGAQLKLKYYDNGIKDIIYYIIHNPGHFVRLMIQRLFSFFKFTRPWYTLKHNNFLVSFILPTYFFFFLGLIRIIKTFKNLTIYLVSFILLYSVAMTFQCDDWHSRFTLLVLPPIFIIAAYGLLYFLNKLKYCFFKS